MYTQEYTYVQIADHLCASMFWNCKVKAASENPSVPYGTDSPFPRCTLNVSLRSQRMVAGSFFF